MNAKAKFEPGIVMRVLCAFYAPAARRSRRNRGIAGVSALTKSYLKWSNAGDDWILAYRTWRIVYNINEPERIVTIKNVLSGYSEEELKNIADDKYQDKELHKRFNKVFGKN